MADHAVQAGASADLLAKFDVFTPGIPLAHCALNQHLQPINVHRLGHKVVGAALHCLHRCIHAAIGGHHDADRRLRQLLDLFHQLHAVFAAESQISDQDIRRLGFQSCKRAGNVRGRVDFVVVLQGVSESIAGILLVIYDQESLI